MLGPLPRSDREIAILAGSGTYTSQTGPVPAKLKNKTENHLKPPQKNTTIMTSRPTILHRRLYFSAYTPPPLAIDGMTDSPDIVRRYGVGGLSGYAR